jgi:predicted lipid carrier protein YhbT
MAFDVRGSGGGQWSCRWQDGELVQVTRRLEASATVVYRTDGATFDAIVAGRETPDEAFYSRKIDIRGDIETGLKLAVLFAQFVLEFPYLPGGSQEARHAAGCPV